MNKIFYKSLFILSLILVSLTSSTFEGDGTNVDIKGANYSNNQKGYNVKFLFEVDSIRVYRFSDGGSDIYFTNKIGTATNIFKDDDETVTHTTHCN